jgi:chemotaxis protein MotB
MAKRERGGGGGGDDGGINPQGWMITFSDLLTLMLTFFVLLFSMSSLDSKALKEMTETASLAGGDGVMEAGQPERVVNTKLLKRPHALPPRMASVSEDLAQYLRMIGRGVSDERRRLLEARILEHGKQNKVEITLLPNGVEISFEEDGEGLGERRISKAARGQLRMIGDAAVDSGARVRVETMARGDDLNSWLRATRRASTISNFIKRHAGIKNERNRLGVAPSPATGGSRKVRMILEMNNIKEQR